MPRIAGVDIPAKKKVRIALRYIYGIGPTNAIEILDKAGIDKDLRAEKLSEGEIAKIRDMIESIYKVEGDLRREISGNIKLLKDTGTYRGLRHIKRLPARGQRSKTNARTAKGRPRVAIAGKKQAPTSK
ncbi:MAG: 30S ribosomal protein S13 [Deltaproteobacteria bacterium CG11_big_fil_rev_8_21_14_0_20_47_16]|nr:MAG: 30S ribosomal protein S13 [Deltaproteobacteria bacterium CG11_big_fil_rev_8_21_14_0_20_47_16]